MEELDSRKDNFIRYCRFVKAIDGATVLLKVSLGYYTTIQHSIRLFGIAVPRGEADEKSKSFISDWFRNHKHSAEEQFPFSLEGYKADSFGRFLGHLRCAEGHELNADLVQTGTVQIFEKR